MKRAVAALTAALLCASGASGGAPPHVDQALIDGDAMPPKLSAFGLFAANDPAQSPASLVKRIEAAAELRRSEWPVTLLRELWHELLDAEAGRRVCEQGEAAAERLELERSRQLVPERLVEAVGSNDRERDDGECEHARERSCDAQAFASPLAPVGQDEDRRQERRGIQLGRSPDPSAAAARRPRPRMAATRPNVARNAGSAS